MLAKYFVALFCFVLSTVAQADEHLVSAQEPEVMAAVLKNAGYEIELTTDSTGDPMIRTELVGMSTVILFYDCETETNDNCGSIQFRTGFDRSEPWTADEAIKISAENRFAAVSLDDEGDPFISWDIVTGDGISVPIFLRSIRRFSEAVDTTADIAFAEQD